jgi:hypothetical protein
MVLEIKSVTELRRPGDGELLALAYPASEARCRSLFSALRARPGRQASPNQEPSRKAAVTGK